MSSHFSLSYFDPPVELNRHILATFCFATGAGQIEDRHPGALGQLVLFPCGEGGLQFGDRFDPAGPGAYLFSGFSSAAAIHMKGPWHAIGASLSPLGWAALSGEPSNEHIDRFPHASEFLGQEVVDFSGDLNRRYSAGEISGDQACHELANWIGARLKQIPPAHERLIETTIGWLGTSLNPEIDRLFEPLIYSRRHAERLVERYFGLPPAALARKYRAIRAAALLSKDDLSDEGEAEIADAFVDQPHMIREIRTYCGYTPSRLGGTTDPIFQTLLQMKNLDRLEQFRAIG
ncbi:MAG: helix-turn-helix domain-containing protein [Pseudomonadota bacterium]